MPRSMSAVDLTDLFRVPTPHLAFPTLLVRPSIFRDSIELPTASSWFSHAPQPCASLPSHDSLDQLALAVSPSSSHGNVLFSNAPTPADLALLIRQRQVICHGKKITVLLSYCLLPRDNCCRPVLLRHFRWADLFALLGLSELSSPQVSDCTSLPSKISATVVVMATTKGMASIMLKMPLPPRRSRPRRVRKRQTSPPRTRQRRKHQRTQQSPTR